MNTISLNGERVAVDDGLTLAGLIDSLGQQPQSLATAVNGDFVPRDARTRRVLQAGDEVLTFQPITGG